MNEIRRPVSTTNAPLPSANEIQNGLESGVVHSSCGLCGGSRYRNTPPAYAVPPDEHFHADLEIELSFGTTAYKLIKPAESLSIVNNKTDRSLISEPIIVLLHGFCNSSYMWESIAALLSTFENGPQAQVLLFDFYGRGRSTWSGKNKYTLGNNLIIHYCILKAKI